MDEEDYGLDFEPSSPPAAEPRGKEHEEHEDQEAGAPDASGKEPDGEQGDKTLFFEKVFVKTLESDIDDKQAVELLLEHKSKGAGLKAFEDSELHRMSKFLSHLIFPAGEAIMKKDEPATFLGIILKGSLRIIVPGLDEASKIILPAGNLIGEISFFEATTRNADVICYEDTIISMITFSDLQDLVQDEPFLQAKFLQAIAVASIQKLRSTIKKTMPQPVQDNEQNEKVQAPQGPTPAAGKQGETMMTKKMAEQRSKPGKTKKKKPVDKSKATIDTLKAQLAAMIEADKTKPSRKEVTTMKAKVKSADKEISSLKQTVTTLTEERAEALETAMGKSEQLIALEFDVLKLKDQHTKDLEKLKEHTEGAATAKHDKILTRTTSIMNKQLGSMKNTADNKQAKIDSLQQQVNALEEHLEAKEKDRQDLEDSNYQLEALVDSLRDDLDKVELKIKNMKSEVADAKEDNQNSKDRCLHAEKECSNAVVRMEIALKKEKDTRLGSIQDEHRFRHLLLILKKFVISQFVQAQKTRKALYTCHVNAIHLLEVLMLEQECVQPHSDTEVPVEMSIKHKLEEFKKSSKKTRVSVLCVHLAEDLESLVRPFREILVGLRTSSASFFQRNVDVTQKSMVLMEDLTKMQGYSEKAEARIRLSEDKYEILQAECKEVRGKNHKVSSELKAAQRQIRFMKRQALQMAQRLNKPEASASHKARRPSASADVEGEVHRRRSRFPSSDLPDDHHHQSQRHAFMPPPNHSPRHFSPERMRTPQLRHHSSQPHLLPGSRHGTGKRTRPSTANVKLETSSWFHDMETRAFAILAKKPASPPQAQPRVV